MGKPPPYTILSHRWEEEEVTLEDIKVGEEAKRKKGYRKLQKACEMAARHNLDYIWIDTCCIDKTSSAELSEAINSMFQYYREAEICYTYLFDVASAERPNASIEFVNCNNPEFIGSAWFKRGWTLQELIAPKEQQFFNKEWVELGTKDELKEAIHLITGIPLTILIGGSLAEEAVSSKMSWVAARQTTIPEDIAYCLLGIFDVNIPLLYGEGMEKAFLRLQEAILKSTDDNSIYLWRSTEEDALQRPYWGLLARSPAYFLKSPEIHRPCVSPTTTRTAATLTGRGVDVEFLLGRIPNDISGSIYAALVSVDMGERVFGILLQKLYYSGHHFTRVGADILLEISEMLNFDETSLPQRVAANWSYEAVSINYLGNFLVPRRLRNPQMQRFYVQQIPRRVSSASVFNEAVGFCFDTESSLPPEMQLKDWSLDWKSSNYGVQDQPAYGRAYLLNCDAQRRNLEGVINNRIFTSFEWDFEVLGVIELLINSEYSSKRVILYVGAQKTLANLLNTTLPCNRPFCLFVVEDSSETTLSTGPRTSADDAFRGFSSQHPQVSQQLEIICLNNNVGSGHGIRRYPLIVSFELQIVHGQAYYLIKVGVA